MFRKLISSACVLGLSEQGDTEGSAKEKAEEGTMGARGGKRKKKAANEET